MSSAFQLKTGVRIPELDGLRGVAILVVLVHHYLSGRIQPRDSPLVESLNRALALSWSGVDLFFVLSGFLIGGILLDQRNTENYFKTFYLRRICRIFPLYFLWLILFLFLDRVLSPSLLRQHWAADAFAPRYPNWAYAVFLQNFFIAKKQIFGPHWLGTIWSLAIEEQFYLIAPLLIRFLPLRKLPYALAAMIVVIPVLRLYSYLYHPAIFVYVLLPYRADALLMGVACAYGIRQEFWRDWLQKHQSHLYPAFIVLLAGVIYLSKRGIDSRTSFEMVFLGYSWLPLFYTCVLLIVITAKQGALAKVMRITLLRNLGIIAYGVFLMHLAMDALAHGLISGRDILAINNLTDGLVTLFALLVTLLLATLSWHYFEKPIVRWGHSFAYTTRKTQLEA
ncbi:MAG TPA: acyltransferase [Candidatus Sulfopaludibacter sp.]|nr:acyltransferase [Candidatus Sulfopaludibacter sp.]